MMKLPIAFIAGKFRGKTPNEIHRNVFAAEEVAAEVSLLGIFPFTPHLNTKNFQDWAPDQLWVDGCLEMLSRCDILVKVPNWQNCSGTLGEIAFAKELKIPVYSLEELQELIKAGRCPVTGKLKEVKQ